MAGQVAGLVLSCFLEVALTLFPNRREVLVVVLRCLVINVKFGPCPVNPSNRYPYEAKIL